MSKWQEMGVRLKRYREVGAGLRTAVISGSSRAARAVRTEVAAGRLRGTALLGTWQKTRSS